MLAITATTLPEMSKRAKKDLQNCINLFMQNNYKQSEIELKKFLRNFTVYKEHLIPKVLSFFFEAFVHRQCENLDEKIQYFMEAIKNDANGRSSFSVEIAIDHKNNGNVFVPYVLVCALSDLNRHDKAVEICKTYLDGTAANSLWLNKFYFNALISFFDFDEQAKSALKLLQMDKSETNKFQVCIAIFLQAVTKPLKKEREMGFEFASKLAHKIFASDNPEYLQEYLEFVQTAKILHAEKPFLGRGNGDVLPNTVRILLVSDDKPEEGSVEEEESAVKLVTSVAENEVSEGTMKQLLSDNDDISLEDKYKAFQAIIEAMKQGPRFHGIWCDTIALMLAIQSADPKSDACSTLASFFHELETQSSSNGLEKEDLIACIRFLRNVPVAAEQCNYGTPAERLDEFIERYGHEFNANEAIYEWFSDLTDEEKKRILDKSKAVLAILKRYNDKRFEVGINTEVIDARTEIIQQKDIEAFGKAAVPTNPQNLVFYYYHRLFLIDMLKLSSAKASDRVDESFVRFINKWIKNVDLLGSVQSTVLAEMYFRQLFIQQITEKCFNLLLELRKRCDNDMYLEILTCFLKRQCEQPACVNPNLVKYFLDCQNQLGFAEHFNDVINKLQAFDLNSVLNFILENTGHFSTAYLFCGIIIFRKRESLQKTVKALEECYSKGEIGNVFYLYEEVHQKMNSLQTARLFSRGDFLKALFAPSLSPFFDSFFKSAWPTELPLSSDLLLESEYLEAITEIKTIRILCHFLVIFNGFKKDGTAAAAFDVLHDHLKYYLAILSDESRAVDEEKENQTVITTSNIFENAVIQPFMKLINVYVTSLATVLSTANLSVNGILEKLPNISKFRACVDEISTILYDLFGKKFNNPQRIRAIADAVKMATYMSRLIAVTYQAVAKYLNVEVEDFKLEEKYKAIYIRFRQYAVELKLLMEIILSLGQKWLVHLSKHPLHFVDESSATTRHTVSAVRAYVQTRYSEYKEAFKGMMQHHHLPSLIEVGLL